MDHQLMKERISDLYDGELRGAELEEVKAHMASCEECRAFHARLGALSGAVAAPALSDEAFTRAVMARIPAKSAGPRIVPVSVRWFAPAFGIAAMLLIALFPASGTVSAEEILTGGQDPLAAEFNLMEEA